MKIKLKNTNTTTNHVFEMKDGDIGIITSQEHRQYVGKIVQRYGDHLICLGSESGNSWTDLFVEKRSSLQMNFYVEVFKDDVELVLEREYDE